MSEKRLKTKIINKHDTQANWEKSSYIPSQAELVVFDIDSTYSYERFKIGDGKTNVNSLPFADAHILDIISDFTSGNTTVAKATHATKADSATEATHAVNADSATHATSADTATKATTADSAAKATTADSATTAGSATKATQDASGNTITTTYETKVDASAKLTEAKNYTDEKVGAIDTLVVSETQPTDANVDLWLNPAASGEFNIPEINDSTTSTVDTWSSKKISEELASLGGGTGTVTSVNGVQPDENGNVEIEVGSQPDWSVNDETNTAYIKNRPFSSEIGEILSPAQMTLGDEIGEDAMMSMHILANAIEGIVVGQTYTVNYNGTDYTCDAKEITEGELVATSLGNLSLLFGTEDTGEPFGLIIVPPESIPEVGVGVVLYSYDVATSVTLGIVGEVIKTLDTKYLPSHLQFGETQGFGGTLTWDGDLTGKEITGNGYFVKVSNITPTMEELQKGTFVGVQGQMMEVTNALHAFNDGKRIMAGTFLCVVFEDGTYLGHPYTKGLYLGINDAVVITTIKITGYKGFPSTVIKPLDSKYLPDDVGVTYQLSKSGSTITLTGSDGSTTSVVDADTNTTYAQGDSSTLGLTKLYTSTGTNTDGTMTQNAITSYVDDNVEMIFASMPAGKPYTWNLSDMTGVIELEGMLVKVISSTAYGMALSGTIMTVTPISGEPIMVELVPLDPNPYLLTLTAPDIGEMCMMMSVNPAYAAMLGVPFSGTLIAVSEAATAMIKSISVSAGGEDSYFIYVNSGEGSDTLTWDGDTTGKSTFEGMTKVSDVFFAASDCVNGGTIVIVDEDGVELSMPFTASDVMDEGGMLTGIGEKFIVSISEAGASLIGIEAGTYFLGSGSVPYIKSLTINGYTFSEKKLQINPEYLPEALQFGQEVPNMGDTLSWDGNGAGLPQATHNGTAVPLYKITDNIDWANNLNCVDNKVNEGIIGKLSSDTEPFTVVSKQDVEGAIAVCINSPSLDAYYIYIVTDVVNNMFTTQMQITFPSEGTYAGISTYNGVTGYLEYLTIEGAKCFPDGTFTISKIDPKYLPDDIGGGSSITIDSVLSSTSENPVQNKVIANALTNKADASHIHTIANITDLQTALDGKAASSHEHSASNITSGTLAIDKGGTGHTSIVDTTYTTARYRASSLHSSETTPSANGVIAWTYE